MIAQLRGRIEQIEADRCVVDVGGVGYLVQASTRTLAVLTRCVGTLRPATATLLLAPPGHGKSSLLRALAGHIPAHELTGTLTYSGVPAAQLVK